MNTFKEVLDKATNLVDELLQEYAREIEATYLKADGPPLDIGFKLRFYPDKEGIKIEAHISFVTDRIKDSASTVVDKKQLGLFDD